MAKTAITLIRELANRQQELRLSTATSNGSTTTLIDTSLEQWWPNDIVPTAQGWFAPWVYPITGTVGNIGKEARGASWATSTGTLTLMGVGLPSGTQTSDTFEIHMRTRRSRKLEALNDALGVLNITHARVGLVDTSLQTAQTTWKYTLPAGQNWKRVVKVELQINTNASYSTYPYADASPWNWDAYPTVDAVTGVETWVIQFALLPPPNSRVLRIFGEGYFSDLVNDSDILVISGATERIALNWIYSWAGMRLQQEQATGEPAGMSARYLQLESDLLQKADYVRAQMPHIGEMRLQIPGRGDGQWSMFPTNADGAWMGAFQQGVGT